MAMVQLFNSFLSKPSIFEVTSSGGQKWKQGQNWKHLKFPKKNQKMSEAVFKEFASFLQYRMANYLHFKCSRSPVMRLS